jgi:hypothetical protein
MGWASAASCLVIFAGLQFWQSLHQAELQHPKKFLSTQSRQIEYDELPRHLDKSANALPEKLNSSGSLVSQAKPHLCKYHKEDDHPLTDNEEWLNDFCSGSNCCQDELHGSRITVVFEV